MLDKKVNVRIESFVDGEHILREGPGEYKKQEDGTQLVAFTDYSGNVITKCGFFIAENTMLLHRTGAMEGDILFDPMTLTSSQYNNSSLEYVFTVHTTQYEVSNLKDKLVVNLSYRLVDEKGDSDIDVRMNITVSNE